MGVPRDVQPRRQRDRLGDRLNAVLLGRANGVEGLIVVAPNLWLTIGGSVALLAVFVVVLRWVTRPDPSVTNDWREIDERVRQRR